MSSGKIKKSKQKSLIVSRVKSSACCQSTEFERESFLNRITGKKLKQELFISFVCFTLIHSSEARFGFSSLPEMIV
jgi:hypothetical protein